MRVVLDTNVLARASSGRQSPARQLLDLLLASPHVLVSSAFILDELGRILRYERVRRMHGLDDAAIGIYLQAIHDASLIVDAPALPVAVAADPNDDPIIAAAIEGQADAICTWDRHLLTPAVQEYLARVGIRVLRDNELLQELSQPADEDP